MKEFFVTVDRLLLPIVASMKKITKKLACGICCAGAVLAWPMVAYANEPIQPIPTGVKLPAQKVSLGERLFNDKRFSRDNTVSCASCHDAKLGGADGRQFSVGVGASLGSINAPTVFNSGFSFRQFWDGRANTLEEQMEGPIHDPKEMGSTWPEILKKLSADATMEKEFKAVYPDGIQQKNIQDAIANFQRAMVTPNARFDKYLRGDKNAISADEIKGYQLFKSYGCVACHQGVNVGGNMFQTFGVMGDYFGQRGKMSASDLGRFNVTKNPADKHVFKVPSLRNVALTAPYFHDGSAKTLGEAIDVMFKYQLGRTASQEDKDLIAKFLMTLTGEYKGQALAPADAVAKK